MPPKGDNEVSTIKTWSEALEARLGDAITSTLDVHRAMQAEIDELRAELAALKEQEPVAWMKYANGMSYLTTNAGIAERDEYDTPLYAAGAQPLFHGHDAKHWHTLAVQRFQEAQDLKQQEPVAQFNWNKGGFEWLTEYSYDKHNMKPLFLAAGAQPVQHVPAGLQHVHDAITADPSLCDPDHVAEVDRSAPGCVAWIGLPKLKNGAKLYAVPVQAPERRKPLSDRQVSWLWSNAHNDTTDRMAFQVFARAIEAKHGITGKPA